MSIGVVGGDGIYRRSAKGGRHDGHKMRHNSHSGAVQRIQREDHKPNATTSH